MKPKPIIETISLWKLADYFKRHKLVVVPASLYWLGDKPQIETRRTPLGQRDT